MTITNVRGFGATFNATADITATPQIYGSAAFTIHTMNWNWCDSDPTEAVTGARLKGSGHTTADYFFTGANTVAGHTTAATEAATLFIIGNIRAIGLAGHKCVINPFTGAQAPQWLVGAPVGSSDFSSGLAGTAGGVSQSYADHSGASNPQFYNAPHFSGTGYTTYRTWWGYMQAALAAELQSQFVSGSSGPTLLDVVIGLRVAGINCTTAETRQPAQWPHLVSGATAVGVLGANGLGSPDCTDKGVLIAPLQFAADGYSATDIVSAHGDITADTVAAFPTQTLMIATIPPTNTAVAFPPINSAGHWPAASINLARTLAHGGLNKTKSTVFALDFVNGQTLSDLASTGGKVFVPYADTSTASGHNGLETISFTGVDTTNGLITGCTGGSGTHVPLAAPASANITAIATATGYPTSTLALTLSDTSGWRDGQLVYFTGMSTSAGKLGTLLNHNIYTARTLVSGGAISTAQATLPSSAATANTITLTDQAGNLVLNPSGLTLAANPDGTCTPIVVAGHTDNATWVSPAGVQPLPVDPTTKTLFTNAATLYTSQIMAMHQDLAAPPPPPGNTDLPVSTGTGTGTLSLDQPFLAWAQSLNLGLQTGGQMNAGVYASPACQSLTTGSGTAGPGQTIPAAKPQGGDTWPSMGIVSSPDIGGTITNIASWGSGQTAGVLHLTSAISSTWFGPSGAATTAGYATIQSSTGGGLALIHYTGISGSTLTGCTYVSGGTGTIITNAAVLPPFQCCVGAGQQTLVMAADDNNSAMNLTVAPGAATVTFTTGDRITHSPNYLPTATNAAKGAVFYVEGFRTANLDADSLAASVLLLPPTVTGIDSITVEAAYGNAPLAPASSLSWENISAKFQSTTTNRGKGAELDQYSAGQAAIKLKNQGYEFNPENGSSPYAPGGLPATPVRLSANDSSGSRHFIFTGFLRQRSPVTISEDGNGNVSYATYNCVDFFGPLATLTLPAIDPVAEPQLYAGLNSGEQLAQLVLDGILPADISRWSGNTGYNTVAGTTIPVGQALVQPYVGGMNALQWCQQMALTEGGQFYIDRRGVANFDDRYSIVSAARMSTVQAVFDDNAAAVAAGTGISYRDLTTDYATTLYNVVQITPANQPDQTVTKTASVVLYTESDLTYSGLFLNDAAEAQARAEWYAEAFDTPLYSPTQIRLHPLKSDAVLDAALHMELRDLVQVKRKPPGASAQVTYNCYVRSISHTIDMATRVWTVDVGLESADRYQFAPNGSTQLQYDQAEPWDGTREWGF